MITNHQEREERRRREGGERERRGKGNTGGYTWVVRCGMNRGSRNKPLHTAVEFVVLEYM